MAPYGVIHQIKKSYLCKVIFYSLGGFVYTPSGSIAYISASPKPLESTIRNGVLG
jgi:hypothetical protein